MPNPNSVWFQVNVNFNENPPTCDQINMPGKLPNGKHPFDGIKFNSNKANCKFTAISIVADVPNEWPAATVAPDGSWLTQEDLYLDTIAKNHTYMVSYTKDGVAGSFDPGIRNTD